MASDSDTDSVSASSKSEGLRSELTSWRASAAQELTLVEERRRFTFLWPPDLGCIVCKKDIDRSPVYQCQTGHLACNRCSQKGHSCPECSKAISRIKNVAVGNMIDALLVSCKFAGLGCKEMTAYSAPRSEHEDICAFAPMKCPMPGCNQAGVKNYLRDHLADKHKISSVVDIEPPVIGYHYKYDTSYRRWNYAELDLGPSTTSVLLNYTASEEFHLLHQESTAVGDRLRITSLTKRTLKPCKRKYEIDVEVGKELTYCYKSVSSSNPGEHAGLLIPKELDGVPAGKKHCKIRMERYTASNE